MVLIEVWVNVPYILAQVLSMLASNKVSKLQTSKFLLKVKPWDFDNGPIQSKIVKLTNWHLSNKHHYIRFTF